MNWDWLIHNSLGEQWAIVELQVIGQSFLIHLKLFKSVVQLLKLLLVVVHALGFLLMLGVLQSRFLLR